MFIELFPILLHGVIMSFKIERLRADILIQI